MDELNKNGEFKLDINGNEVVLTKDDLLIDTAQTEGYVSENNQDITVVLDSNLTCELIEEGFVREIISKIQTMRKEADFEVMDHITVYHMGNDTIEKIFAKYEKEIMAEVLADKVVAGKTAGYVKEWNINSETVTLGVERHKNSI